MSDWYSQQPDTLESIMGELAATDRPPPPQPAPPTSALMLPRDDGVAAAMSYVEPVAAGYNVRDRSAPDAWKKYDDEQLQKEIAPHSYLPYGVATQQEAEHAYRSTGESLRDWYLPTTTWGAGLTGATAAAAKSLPGPAKLAGLAAGFALSPSEADASFLKAPPGKLLTRAEKLLSEGASVRDIWDRTGLFQGADGIWRYEIPDKGSRWLVDPMKLVGEKNLKLGDVFEHKALFPQAPWLPETKLTVTREHPDIGGGFLRGDPATGRKPEIEVNVDYAHDTPHGVIMHEGTHATQAAQDLNAGTNINTNPLSAEAQDIYNDMLGKFLNRPSEAELRAQGIVGKGYSYKQFMKEYNDALSDLPRLDKELRDKAAMQSYTRSAGENEADIVQRRANKDPEYLINVPPPADYQVPIEKQIVTFNKGQLKLPDLAVEPWQMATKKPTGFAPSKGFAPGSIAEPPVTSPSIITRTKPTEADIAAIRARAQEPKVDSEGVWSPRGPWPTAEREVFSTKPKDYEETSQIVPQVSVKSQLPGPLPGEKLPNAGRAQQIIDNADPLADRIAERLYPLVKRQDPLLKFYHTAPVIRGLGKHADMTLAEANDLMRNWAGQGAATSPRTSTPPNLRNTSSLMYERAQDNPFTLERFKKEGNIPGYGMMGMHVGLGEKFAANAVNPWKNPKPFTFRENWSGNLADVTGDTHNIRGTLFEMDNLMPGQLHPSWFHGGEKGEAYAKYKREGFRALDPGDINDSLGTTTVKKVERQSEYLPMVEPWYRAAKKLGIHPAEGQSGGWFEYGPITGLASPPKTIVNLLNDQIADTAKTLNVSPEKVVDWWAHGKIPLTGLAGALGAGGIMGEVADQRKYK